MRKYVQALQDSFRQAFNALEHEYGAEMLSRRGKAKVLGAADIAARPASPANEQQFDTAPRKRVVCAFGREFSPATLRYAMDIARRFEANIDILSQLDEQDLRHKLDKEFADPGVDWTIYRVNADLLGGITQHVSRNTPVMFVVTSEKDTLTEQLALARPANWTLNAPWLVITDELCVA